VLSVEYDRDYLSDVHASNASGPTGSWLNSWENAVFLHLRYLIF
jgi:hypothetical protein